MLWQKAWDWSTDIGFDLVWGIVERQADDQPAPAATAKKIRSLQVENKQLRTKITETRQRIDDTIRKLQHYVDTNPNPSSHVVSELAKSQQTLRRLERSGPQVCAKNSQLCSTQNVLRSWLFLFHCYDEIDDSVLRNHLEQLNDILFAKLRAILIEEKAGNAHDLIFFLQFREPVEVVNIRGNFLVKRCQTLRRGDELGAHRAGQADKNAQMTRFVPSKNFPRSDGSTAWP